MHGPSRQHARVERGCRHREARVAAGERGCQLAGGSAQSRFRGDVAKLRRIGVEVVEFLLGPGGLGGEGFISGWSRWSNVNCQRGPELLQVQGKRLSIRHPLAPGAVKSRGRGSLVSILGQLFQLEVADVKEVRALST